MKELLDQLHGLLYTAQRSAGGKQVNAINEARLVLAKIREQQPGAAFDPADMATAAAQGFRDGANEDTARLRFVAETLNDDDPPEDMLERCDKELPDGVKTLEDIRKLIDIRRGLV